MYLYAFTAQKHTCTLLSPPSNTFCWPIAAYLLLLALTATHGDLSSRIHAWILAAAATFNLAGLIGGWICRRHFLGKLCLGMALVFVAGVAWPFLEG